jgi:hypothetical protein
MAMHRRPMPIAIAVITVIIVGYIIGRVLHSIVF